MFSPLISIISSFSISDNNEFNCIMYIE